MKYFITEYKNQNEKNELKRLGLYCYDIRQSDFGGEYAGIEKNVLVNRAGSIITDKSIYLTDSYPSNYIDFDIFASENQEVHSLDELLISKIYLTTLKLDSDNRVDAEFDFLFSDCENYLEINMLPSKEKRDYILDHYEDVGDYDLVDIGNQEYKLYRIDYSRTIERIKKQIDKER